jgi:hypothetical protein
MKYCKNTKYYEILFTDSYGICIKSDVEQPSREQVWNFLKTDMMKYHYKTHDIESIDEISLEEASLFYDMENEKGFSVLKQ